MQPQSNLDAAFSALADPTRRAILARLAPRRSHSDATGGALRHDAAGNLPSPKKCWKTRDLLPVESTARSALVALPTPSRSRLGNAFWERSQVHHNVFDLNSGGFALCEKRPYGWL